MIGGRKLITIDAIRDALASRVLDVLKTTVLTRNEFGDLLYVAVVDDWIECVQWILDNDYADVNGSILYCPLCAARSVAAVNVLLAAGANVNRLDGIDNQSALSHAILNWRRSVAMRLIDAGARLHDLGKHLPPDWAVGFDARRQRCRAAALTLLACAKRGSVIMSKDLLRLLARVVWFARWW